MWRVVAEGQPLSEVSRWRLWEVYSFNALLDMRADHEAAFSAYHKDKLEKSLGDDGP